MWRPDLHKFCEPPGANELKNDKNGFMNKSYGIKRTLDSRTERQRYWHHSLSTNESIPLAVYHKYSEKTRLKVSSLRHVFAPCSNVTVSWLWVFVTRMWLGYKYGTQYSWISRTYTFMLLGVYIWLSNVRFNVWYKTGGMESWYKIIMSKWGTWQCALGNSMFKIQIEILTL